MLLDDEERAVVHRCRWRRDGGDEEEEAESSDDRDGDGGGGDDEEGDGGGDEGGGDEGGGGPGLDVRDFRVPHKRRSLVVASQQHVEIILPSQ